VQACRRRQCECRHSSAQARGARFFLQAVADLVGSVLPTMERLGVATAAEAEVATLAERLRLEVTAAESVIIGRSEIGAWSRV
jgi:hypothetical protein